MNHHDPREADLLQVGCYLFPGAFHDAVIRRVHPAKIMIEEHDSVGVGIEGRDGSGGCFGVGR